MLKVINDLDLKGKKVFIRVDFNVPVKDGKVSDDTRIVEALETILYAKNSGAKVILGSHLGRPKGEKNLDYTLKVVADYINEKGFFDIKFVDDCIGVDVEKAIESMNYGDVLLLENLRFYKGEEKNDKDFTDQLGAFYDVYINDAFGTSHRKHSSTYGLAELIPIKAAGFLVEKEARYFDSIIKSPAHPFAAIVGGAKISDKIGVIDSLIDVADIILIGGAMAYTFLKYNDYSIGTSMVEDDEMDTVRKIYEKADKKNVSINLPLDHIISDKFCGEPVICSEISIPDNYMGLDIGEKSIAAYKALLTPCKTVLWNGPMGVFESEAYSKGTFCIAEILSKLDNATVIVGGGDSVSAVKKAGVSDKIAHISTGGGASLEYIEFGKLPCIEVLR